MRSRHGDEGPRAPVLSNPARLNRVRYVLVLVALVGLLAVLTRAPGAWRSLYVIMGLMLVYTVLKLTGLIEAIAPD